MNFLQANCWARELNEVLIKAAAATERCLWQDVVSHHKSLKKYREKSSSNLQPGGLKALSKHSKERLDAYQHLFYLLQVSDKTANVQFPAPLTQTRKTIAWSNSA